MQENFGLDKLEVRDNGSGIPKEDVAYIAKCHYTSKLKDITDLNTLETYGFRGEALSSLATVASLSVTTATKENDVGMVYSFDAAGNVRSKRPIAASTGTCVTATDLFVNVPVRRQFYKNAKQCRDERRKVEHLMIAFGLVHNTVRFVLRHSRNVIWQKAAMSCLHSNMIAIFGSSLVQQMKWLQSSKDGVAELSGYFPALRANSTEVTRSSADHMYVFVNKRLVDIKQVNQVIRDVFKSSYTNKRFPVMCLFISVPQSEVDVNLEPGKHSILLHNLNEILDQLIDLLGQLYEPEAEGDHLMKQQELAVASKSDAIVMDENFSQFSDNAVLSPPTINNSDNQQVLPSITDDETFDENFAVSNKQTDSTASCAFSSSTVSGEDLEDDVTMLQSPDVENQPRPLKEVDERTADTVIITPEDSSADSTKDRPFKISTSDCVLNWSKGQSKEGDKMEPVSLLQKDRTSMPSHVASLRKKPATSGKLSREGCKSIKKSSQKMKLTNFFDKIGTSRLSSEPKVVVKFYKDHVCTYWEEDKNFIVQHSNRPSVIGPINQRHQWLVVVDQHIQLFDVKRANQNVLYSRLMASFKLPASPLASPVTIGDQ